MGVKSTIDLGLVEARALVRALVPEDTEVEDKVLGELRRGWNEVPGLKRSFLAKVRDGVELSLTEGELDLIGLVLTEANDIRNDGEGYRNFCVCHGEVRSAAPSLKEIYKRDYEIASIIEDELGTTSSPSP